MKIRYKNDAHIFDIKEVEGTPYLSYPKLEQTGIVSHGFSTRLGGVSTGNCYSMNISTNRGDAPDAIAENKRRIARAVGVDEKKMVFTNQTHTTNVAVVTADDFGKVLEETDGLITDTPGLCLVTFYADCVPLYFVDPIRRAIGLSHSGWRGTVNKMANVTVDAMRQVFGSKPEDLIAAIGPSICRDCYEIGEDVAKQFRSAYSRSDLDTLLDEKGNGKYQLDLWRANEINLTEAGVLKEHIAVTNVCTCCNPDVLFSHRITGFARGNLSAFLALKESC